MGAKLYALRDGFLYLGAQAFSGPTQRQPVVLLASLSGEPISLRAGDMDIRATLLLVAPGVVRSFTLAGDGIASLNIEPSHPLYPALVRRLTMPALALSVDSTDEFSNIVAELGSLIAGEACDVPVASLFARAVALLESRLDHIGDPRDLRVDALVDLLRETGGVDFDYNWCRRHLALSPSRLSHLFTEQVGLSMRSFIAWRKTKDALCRLSSTPSITRVAHEAGFADSAHLSRTFKTTIGILPSKIGFSRQIQFHDLRA